MPHPNVLAEIQRLGPQIAQLDRLTDELPDLSGRQTWAAKLAEICEFVRNHKLERTIVEQANNRYAYIRELAAVVILDLWQERLILPYDENNLPGYEQLKNEHLDRVAWTLPVIERLFQDKRSGPIELAARITQELEDAPEDWQQRARTWLIDAYTSRFPRVRLKVVQSLLWVYQTNDDALALLDDAGHQLMLRATHDADARVRDWACFELHLKADVLGPEDEAAFNQVIKLDGSESDGGLEAVIGLARLGDMTWQPLMLKKLSQFDTFGSGWVDVAEHYHTPEALDALILAHSEILRRWPDASIIDSIERALRDWDE